MMAKRLSALISLKYGIRPAHDVLGL